MRLKSRSPNKIIYLPEGLQRWAYHVGQEGRREGGRVGRGRRLVLGRVLAVGPLSPLDIAPRLVPNDKVRVRLSTSPTLLFTYLFLTSFCTYSMLYLDTQFGVTFGNYVEQVGLDDLLFFR